MLPEEKVKSVEQEETNAKTDSKDDNQSDDSSKKSDQQPDVQDSEQKTEVQTEIKKESETVRRTNRLEDQIVKKWTISYGEGVTRNVCAKLTKKMREAETEYAR